MGSDSRRAGMRSMVWLALPEGPLHRRLSCAGDGCLQRLGLLSQQINLSSNMAHYIAGVYVHPSGFYDITFANRMVVQALL